MTQSSLFNSNLLSKKPIRRNSAPNIEEVNSFSIESISSTDTLPSPTTSAARTHQYRLNAAQEQRTYRDSCQRLINHIQSVKSICQDLKKSNQDKFPITYPYTSSRTITRSQTLDTRSSQILEAVRQSNDQPSLFQDLNILSLDLKLGRVSTDLASLESSAISTLLNDRLDQSLLHLEKLHTRVADTSSKVLVTGDLNSGKSTFVNALLKKDLLPVDQQPCTGLFCEVLDAMLNDGLEQVHAIPDVELYQRLDPSTYHVIEMRHLFKVITEDTTYRMLKIYTTDCRTTQESLLHNGVVDIALIDSPGLNTDSVKTTAVFARQEEIDVVVFVVSAENHFTLSGKEFLWNAANEKTHIFIVVNRFDSIRDKDRCKRLILEQIRQLSPATYADADDLVHFVSAGSIDLENRTLDPPDFARLEERLRAFVLENRTQSKLLPAKNYLLKLLTDVQVLAESNRQRAAQRLTGAHQTLEHDLPAYQHLLSVRDRLLSQVEKSAERTVTGIQQQAQAQLSTALESIGRSFESLDYPGFFLLWQYAQDVADSLSAQMTRDVRHQVLLARQQTDLCLDSLHQAGLEHLQEYPRANNQLTIKHRPLTVQVETSDFFDLVWEDKSAALSLGAAAMLGGRMLGLRDALSTLSSVLESREARRWAIPVLGLVSVGCVVYVVSDMRYAVERKLLKKFKLAARDSGYVEAQAHRIARESRKILRVEAWEIQNRLQKAIEEKDQKRQETEKVMLISKETLDYFASVLAKSNNLLEKVQMIPTDPVMKEHP